MTPAAPEVVGEWTRTAARGWIPASLFHVPPDDGTPEGGRRRRLPAERVLGPSGVPVLRRRGPRPEPALPATGAA